MIAGRGRYKLYMPQVHQHHAHKRQINIKGRLRKTQVDPFYSDNMRGPSNYGSPIFNLKNIFLILIFDNLKSFPFILLRILENMWEYLYHPG